MAIFSATSPTNENTLLPSAERNILHNYRSWTYNFCIGAITPEAVSDHKFLERDINAYTVLNSAGKGTKGIGMSAQGLNATNVNFQDSLNLINEFNANSPGRFDMYIDNLSVDSLITAGSNKTGASVATNIGFEVFEPLSMNGFVEALQVAGRAAGYSDYMKAAYVIRVQFQGYPDSATTAQLQSEIIPMCTRYFPITITQVEVDVTEEGTRYKINSVPVNQMAFGEPNKLTSDIKVAGNSIGEVLSNFFLAINQMVSDRTKQQTDKSGQDMYEISCPKLSTVGNPQNTKQAVLNLTGATSNQQYVSEIINEKINDELTSANVFKMGDPSQFKNGYVAATVPGSTSTNATSNPSTGKLTPKTATVVFTAGAQIHDCISAIVRDSSYVKNLLLPENLDKVKKGDGLVTYFTVRMETDILGDDKVGNKKFQRYRYVLEPYQMHYSRIPGQEQGSIDMSELKKKIKREYNYIYTGKNEDVIKFNLKFDNLYFSAIPAMLGNRSADDAKAKSAAPDNVVEARQEGTNIDTSKQPANSNPNASIKVDSSQNNFTSKATGGQPQQTPYARMAVNLHDAVLNGVDMIGGTLDILGDPYYLVTGGMGNTDLNLKEPMLTNDGQAPTTQGALYININFRNPIDINSKTGLLDFGNQPVSFSGIFQVLTLKNNFKDGMFTQALEIMRVPGQILGSEKEVLPSNIKTSPLAGQQVVKDTAPANILRNGIRASDFSLSTLLKRGLPTFNLPGSVSNFTNSLVDGASSLASGVLNQVNGLTGEIGNLSSQLGIDPVSGLNALTSGIRLSASGLSSVGDVTNLSAANITVAGNSIGDITAIASAPTKLASNVVDAVSSLPTTGVNSLVQNVDQLANTNVNGLVGDAKNSITGLQNTIPADINAVGAKLGIDPSAIAGLSPNLLSKMVTELEDVAKNIPKNTNLTSLKEQGISFVNITRSKLSNLPAIQPIVKAPAALVDSAYEEISSKYTNVKSVLSGKTNLPNLTDIAKATNPLGTVSAGLNSAVGFAESTIGSVSAANSYVNNTLGSALGVTNNVGSLGQNAIDGFSPASLGLGSVESNLTNVSNLVQSPAQGANNLGISVSNQFGSLQSSPLAKLIQTSNNQGIV